MTIESRFWPLFETTMGRKFDRENQEAANVEEWDSMKHIELIFELESEFDVQFSPKDIADLYSSTTSLIQFLQSRSSS